ncbi:uncharacterized protein L969DRAFT_101791 [Mixia osmundae IAM 14324]|uniref:Uncharacterized protein n=1 Tax=Mixia osmundae (strain CBS 9802 / IAM 14324 / JCM 22182 / KY 12970) TaxID=764103 RepID=G7DYN7_MIXOS|nr:uncharacterized protein L969DRAFT_101791 [Mixia osmundae IAM 14324]KEI41596.1 hypothetical protein L969DRAFT_101791 [Mixia osmundae IAM 14324]GAA95697.1 hypothetical protein E5Q_02354 [Mixia osmundae IAM 14324]
MSGAFAIPPPPYVAVDPKSNSGTATPNSIIQAGLPPPVVAARRSSLPFRPKRRPPPTLNGDGEPVDDDEPSIQPRSASMPATPSVELATLPVPNLHLGVAARFARQDRKPSHCSVGSTLSDATLSEEDEEEARLVDMLSSLTAGTNLATADKRKATVFSTPVESVHLQPRSVERQPINEWMEQFAFPQVPGALNIAPSTPQRSGRLDRALPSLPSPRGSPSRIAASLYSTPASTSNGSLRHSSSWHSVASSHLPTSMQQGNLARRSEDSQDPLSQSPSQTSQTSDSDISHTSRTGSSLLTTPSTTATSVASPTQAQRKASLTHSLRRVPVPRSEPDRRRSSIDAIPQESSQITSAVSSVTARRGSNAAPFSPAPTASSFHESVRGPSDYATPTLDSDTFSCAREEPPLKPGKKSKLPPQEPPPNGLALRNALKCYVQNEDGVSIQFSQLIDPFRQLNGDRTIVIFIRNWSCALCLSYLQALMKLDQTELRDLGVRIVIIGCAGASLIKRYKELAGCPYDLYTDSSMKLHKLLGFKKSLDPGSSADKGDYIPFGMGENLIRSTTQGLKLKTLNPGPMSALGGELVLQTGDQGIECIYSHRMRTTRDHGSLDALLRAAGADGEINRWKI